MIHDQITGRPQFEVLCEPESNILCFRHTGSDELQTRIRQKLMRDGDFLLSQADVSGRRWLRLTIMNPLTNEATIHRLLDTIEEVVLEGDLPPLTGEAAGPTYLPPAHDP